MKNFCSLKIAFAFLAQSGVDLDELNAKQSNKIKGTLIQSGHSDPYLNLV